MAAPAGFIPDAPVGFVADQPAAPTPPSKGDEAVARYEAVRQASPIPDPLVVAGRVMRLLRTPVKAAFDVAGQADVAAGIKSPETAARRAETYANIPIPMAVGALTGGASLPAQSIIQMGTTAAMQEGGLEPKSVPNVVASGTMPWLAAGIGRLARAIPRSLTRMIPSRFAAAQTVAQEAGEKVVKGFEPPSAEATGELWKSARAAGAERIPATQLARMLDSLDESIPKNPTNPGLQTTRELMNTAREAIKANQTIDLGDLMRLRLDVGRSSAKAPEVAAIYRGILGDLEAASAGGPGAQLAMQALDMSRKAKGAEILQGLIEKSSRQTALSGDTKLLDMAKLSKLIDQNRDELLSKLGPGGVGQIDAFVTRFRGLPPAQAYTWANKIAGMGAGGIGIGATVPGLPAVVGGALGYELLNNALAVGKNPAELNRFLISLGAGLRAGAAGGLAEDAMKAKR